MTLSGRLLHREFGHINGKVCFLFFPGDLPSSVSRTFTPEGLYLSSQNVLRQKFSLPQETIFKSFLFQNIYAILFILLHGVKTIQTRGEVHPMTKTLSFLSQIIYEYGTHDVPEF